MDASAIEKIQECAAPLVKIEQTPFQAMLAHNNYKIVNLEYLQTHRDFFRGAFETQDMDEYARYVEDHRSDEEPNLAKCFINQAEFTSTTIFDIGNEVEPGHCRHTAKLVVPKTAEFISLEEIIDSNLTQQVCAEWLEDWRDYLTAYNSDMLKIEINHAILAVRRMTIKSINDESRAVEATSSSRSSLEKIEADNKEQIPVFFTFTCFPYQGLSNRSIDLRLSLITKRAEQPYFVLRITRKDLLVQEMAAEFKALLVDKLPSDVQVYIGKYTS